MSKGEKKTKTAQTNKLPAWYEAGATNAIKAAQDAAAVGYIPWMGADVAALSPQAIAGMQGTDAMSSAFGMPTSSGSYLPAAQEFGGGVKGYSGFGGFEESMNALKAKYPAAYDLISKYSKLGEGQSYNPNQTTPMQSQLAPGFNATMSALGGGPANAGAPGGKGSGGMPSMDTMMANMPVLQFKGGR